MRSMHRDQDEGRVFTRRTIVAAGASIALLGTVAARLYHLQVMQKDHYTRLAEDNRVNRRLLAPIRGHILDRDGLVLAGNSRNYRVMILPEQIPADASGRPMVAATLDQLANILPISERMRERILKEARQSPRFRPLMVAEGLSWEDFSRLNVLLPDLPGVQPEVGERRDYPYGPHFSHVLGYVGRVADSDIEAMRRAAARMDQKLDPVLEETLHLPTFRIGKSGVEFATEEGLRGDPGAEQVEVNAFGREIKLLSHHDGEPGADVHLTLDGNLQNYIMDRLQGQSAAVVVLDVSNGDILALASVPGFDPNPFAIGLTNEQWIALRDDEFNPLINKPLAGQYPPGSTFKLATALAALESGKIRPEQTFFCSGSFPFGEHVFHCWKKEGHGWMNFHDGIKNSCDSYFYQVSLAAGIDRIAKSARDLGLGTNYGFILSGAKNGLIPDTQWKKRALGVKWYDGETLSAAIGQGYILATPLQLAVMVARVANGGRAIVPRLVHAIGDTLFDSSPAPDLGIDPGHLALVREGMNGVSNEPGGTAFVSRITEPGFELCGKTGTAQVRAITMQERLGGVIKNEDLPWKLRDHALFVAYAPAHKPAYAISVLIEHGGGGGKTAAPIGRDILLYAQKRDPLSRPPRRGLRAAALSPSGATLGVAR
jgi:penicillin-binding protein 2